MAKCKHELPNLCGTADGILCRRCGAVFKNFAELRVDAGDPEDVTVPAPEPAPAKAKRSRKKSAE